VRLAPVSINRFDRFDRSIEQSWRRKVQERGLVRRLERRPQEVVAEMDHGGNGDNYGNDSAVLFCSFWDTAAAKAQIPTSSRRPADSIQPAERIRYTSRRLGVCPIFARMVRVAHQR
jgi:hypothetical protein